MKISSVSIIVPCYNERDTLPKVYEALIALDLEREKQVIIVDDGSTDGTREWLSKKAESIKKDEFNASILFHDSNRGKGTAIQTALPEVTGEFVVIQDADLEYNPKEIATLLSFAEQADAPVVYGSRNSTIKNQSHYIFFYLGTKLMDLLINILYHQHLTDAQTCYKFIDTNLLRFIEISESGFGADMEITLKLSNLGIIIQETPISYTPRSFHEGKKIRARDGLHHLFLILAYLFRDLHFGMIDRLVRWFRLRIIQKYVIFDSDDVVLDVGCGRQGVLGWKLRDKIKKYIGVDLSLPALTFRDLQFMSLDVRDIRNVIPAGSVTKITGLAIFEHLEHPEDFLQDAFKILKPGGMLIVTTPAPQAKPILEFIAHIRLIDKKEIDDHKDYFGVARIEEMLKKAGLKIVVAQSFLLGLNGIFIAKKPMSSLMVPPRAHLSADGDL